MNDVVVIPQVIVPVIVMDAPAFPFQGPGTKDNILIEIFASRSNSQISALSEAYLQGEHGVGGWRGGVFPTGLFVA